MIFGVLPTVPEYYKTYINPKVDLAMTPKQCCPFHKEDTPSFSYDGRTGRWSCFGQCHAHGDVIEMHRRWFHLTTPEEAEKDLRHRYKVPMPTIKDKMFELKRDTLIPQDKIDMNVNYASAILNAKTPEQWLELDEIMSEVPVNESALIRFNYKYGISTQQQESDWFNKS